MIMTNVNEGSRSVKRAGRRIVGSTKEGDYARARASAKTLVHGIESSRNRAAESAKKDPNFGKKILARIEASKKKKEMPKEDPKLKRQGVYDSIEIDRTEFMQKLIESAANYEAKYKLDEALIGKQGKLDVNKNGKLDSADFKMLRGSKKKKKKKM